MRFLYVLSLLLLVSYSKAGLVQRRYRDVSPAAVELPAVPVILSEPVASELRQDQIPVQVIELLEPEPVQSLRKVELVAVVAEPAEPVANEILATQTDILSNAETADIAEDIAVAFKEDQKLRAVDAVVEAERRIDEQLVQEEVQQVVQEENQELLRAVAEVEQAAAAVQQAEAVAASVQQPAKLLVEEKPLEVVPAVAVAETTDVQQLTETAQPLKALPVPDDVPVVVDVENENNLNADPLAAAEPLPNLRQATQATPTQTSTQQNFVQQLIQPIGQFISQFTGVQPQQQQPTGQVAADQPAAPGPTLPGFLNPSAAITSAQQAVQNVVNTTSQAFQGLQSFATNLGTSFQNTLSNLGGQQQSGSDAVTARPPGPIQTIVTNLIGGNNPQASTTSPNQQQGPLQGIISFFQGGNRPQGAVAAAMTAPAEPAKDGITPASAAVVPAIPEVAAASASIDDKIGVDQAAEEEEVVTNEVRNSAEVAAAVVADAVVANEAVEDSFEESQPEELIVVNDDAEQSDVVA